MSALNLEAQTYVPSFMRAKMAAAAAKKQAPQPQQHTTEPPQVPAQLQPQPKPQAPPVAAAAPPAMPAASPPPPAATPATKSRISVTRTSANTTSPMPHAHMLQLSPKHGSAPSVPMPYPPPSPASLATRSPAVQARSKPARMSPAFAPRHMNPNAMEFVPGGHAKGAGGGLEALPTSTADMELGKTPAAAAAMTPPAAVLRSVHNSPMIQPAHLEARSALEIAEIIKHSGLKVDAAAYVPQRTMARVVLMKPSPLTLIPSEDPENDNIEMMLDDLWCLFYLPSTWGENIKEEDYNPTLVFRLDSIPTFWKVINNIPSPTELGLSTLYLFRDGIDPKWEDVANRDGGIVKVKVPSAQIDEAWELLLCRTIGDSWSPAVRQTVNGVVLKVRERAYWLELWVTKDSPQLQRDLAQLWQPTLGASFATTYLSHAMMQERSHAAAALAAEKQKKNRRRY